jgi:hypothetical protein
MNEADQAFYLAELHRVARPGACIAVTVHGERALDRAMKETAILNMLGIDGGDLARASAAFKTGTGFHFARQRGHLTTDTYDYGITFIARRWIDAAWSKWYDIELVPGGIHDFQDVVVLRRR